MNQPDQPGIAAAAAGLFAAVPEAPKGVTHERERSSRKKGRIRKVGHILTGNAWTTCCYTFRADLSRSSFAPNRFTAIGPSRIPASPPPVPAPSGSVRTPFAPDTTPGRVPHRPAGPGKPPTALSWSPPRCGSPGPNPAFAPAFTARHAAPVHPRPNVPSVKCSMLRCHSSFFVVRSEPSDIHTSKTDQ
jgi:hypothetical protein